MVFLRSDQKKLHHSRKTKNAIEVGFVIVLYVKNTVLKLVRTRESERHFKGLWYNLHAIT